MSEYKEMPRRRLEERDLRSLERRSMYSIFRALDPNEPPVKSPPRSMYGRFTRPTVDEFSWKFALGLLFVPALLALVELELLFQIPQMVGWLFVVAFSATYMVATLVVLRKL